MHVVSARFVFFAGQLRAAMSGAKARRKREQFVEIALDDAVYAIRRRVLFAIEAAVQEYADAVAAAEDNALPSRSVFEAALCQALFPSRDVDRDAPRTVAETAPDWNIYRQNARHYIGRV